MKTRETTPGKTYSVHTSSGCTVSDKNGWSKTIDAPDGYFTAHAGEVTIDGDDAADVRELFKLAPQQRLALLGVLGGNVSGKLKYANCVTVDDAIAVYGARDFCNDVTEDGVWNWSLKNANATNFLSMSDAEYSTYGTKMKKAVVVAPSMINAGYLLKSQTKLMEAYVNLPNATNISQFCWICRSLKKAKIYAPKAKQAFHAFSAMYDARVHDIDIELPSLNDADGFAVSAKFSKASVLTLLASLPSYTSGSHMLTLGIHVDHKYDPEVNLALKKTDINYTPTVELPEEVTAGKGWKLTVQWNGTPTSTASTMAMGSLIYAKVGEMERPDGMTERYLDWGHYVTDWEARGYEQFRSLASAYRYFGLPMPEETT